MRGWLNPRVLVIAASIAVLVSVSLPGPQPLATAERDVAVCAVFWILYGWAFLLPIARTLGVKSILWPFLLMTLAWLSVALALVADVLPRTAAERQEHPFNIPMILCFTAGWGAFTLFFMNVTKAYRMRAHRLYPLRRSA